MLDYPAPDLMLIRTLVNAALKRTIRHLWDDLPTVGAMRKTYMDADRLGAIGRKRMAVTLDDVGGVRVEWIGPQHLAREGMVVHLHGGGFAMRPTLTDRRFGGWLAGKLGRPVLLVPYRLAPEFPFPAGLDDCSAVYAGLLAAGVPATRIVVTGHSAGGNLALAMLMRARRVGLPQPGGAILMSAPIDLTAASPSVAANATKDCMMGPNAWPWTWQVYLGAIPPDHPDASPLLGDWAGLAPIHLHVSSQEILLDDSRRGAELARTANTPVRLTIWHDVPHSFYFMEFLAEARRCRADMLAFVRSVLRC
ncbi:alpha/beta hydrolase [Duganella sp. BJB488]|nr:alpha/beta hydrolase [Duganella sp. BJB488]RFP31679.1 alpha/beta hydrolase [Duganella sp. BJB480]